MVAVAEQAARGVGEFEGASGAGWCGHHAWAAADAAALVPAAARRAFCGVVSCVLGWETGGGGGGPPGAARALQSVALDAVFIALQGFVDTRSEFVKSCGDESKFEADVQVRAGQSVCIPVCAPPLDL